METLYLVILLLMATVASSLVDKKITSVSLPLVQIAIGVVICLVFPALGEVEIGEELFMVLFIAPLLFDETRHVNKINLWKNKAPVASLAIGLVFVSMLVIGVVLHCIFPDIPLAAAFALGAALGPTDAVAVASLGKSISLSGRQKSLLSGEALINDASGVVGFQFAIAAMLTGYFSVLDAGLAFSYELFGGIGIGILVGIVLKRARKYVRQAEIGSSAIHVIVDIVAPFLLFLVAEAAGASGVLAVVAGGLVLNIDPKKKDIDTARATLVTSSVWEVIVFAINGFVFILLGMQIPGCLLPVISETSYSASMLIGSVFAATAVLILIRFVWVFVIEFIHSKRVSFELARSSLVTTLAGPKGAVTLSVIMTLPYLMPDGSAFSARSVLVFVAAGTIVCTLLLANFLLPIVAQKRDVEESGQELSAKHINILQQVIIQLCLTHNEKNEPGVLAAIEHFRGQLKAAQEGLGVQSATIILLDEIYDKQIKAIQSAVQAGDASCDDGDYYINKLHEEYRAAQQLTQDKHSKRGIIHFAQNKNQDTSCNNINNKLEEAASKAKKEILIKYKEGDNAILSQAALYLETEGKLVEAMRQTSAITTDMPSNAEPTNLKQTRQNIEESIALSREIIEEGYTMELALICDEVKRGELSQKQAQLLRKQIHLVQMGNYEM